LTPLLQMARKKIREYDSKRLLKAHIARLAGLQLPIAVAQVKENTNFAELIAGEPMGGLQASVQRQPRRLAAHAAHETFHITNRPVCMAQHPACPGHSFPRSRAAQPVPSVPARQPTRG
jgi:hypothetical protein